MPVPGTQVNLTLGQETTIPTPSGINPSVGQHWFVEIDNLSPWVLTVNVSGKTYLLAPGVAQLYSSQSGPAAVTVIPSGATYSGTAYVLSNWAVYPDHIPGTFPVVIAPATNVTIVTPPIPPSTVNYSVIVTATGSAQTLSAGALTIGLAFLADPKNTGNFHIGATNVTTGSAYLAPGQGVVLPVQNANEVAVLGTSGDKLSVWGA